MSRSFTVSFAFMKVMLGVCVSLLVSTLNLRAQGKQLFKGQIVECTCDGTGVNAAASDKRGVVLRCSVPCANGGGSYALVNSRTRIAYQLDKQDIAKAYAAGNVFVIGTLDKAAGTIHINNIVPDLSPAIKRAKTVAIVCDACPRGMAKAKPAAFEELTVWKRFAIVPDPRSADLVFLFSANPYRGDYVTRDGPDSRPVRIETTFMNIVDPKTGESLWGDRERMGSWFVADATRDMIDELREFMEADESSTQSELFLKRHWVNKIAADTGK